MVVVFAAGTVAGLLGAAQAGLSLVLGIIHLAPVLQVGKARFHILKLGCVHHVLIAGGQNGGNLLLGLRGARRGLRMAVKCLIEEAGLLFLQGFDFFEEGGKRLRVVAGLVQVLNTEVIGLGFEAA